MKIIEHIEKLLQPVSEDNPAGIYLKDNRAVYRPLRNSFNVAQTSFRKLTNNPPEEELDELQKLNKDNWRDFSTQLLDVIADQSKDIECMSWLMLAQLFSDHPYENLTAVLKLVSKAIEQCGDHIHPRTPDRKLKATSDDERFTERVTGQLRPLANIFGQSDDSCLLSLPLRMLPLVGDLDYMAFRADEEQGKRAELQKMARQILATEQTKIRERVLAIGEALDALTELDQVLAGYAGEQCKQIVNSRFIRNQLTASLNALQILTEGSLVPWPLDAAQVSDSKEKEVIDDKAVGDTKPSNTDEPRENNHGEALYNRDQAFQQLRLIADYFARTEPQSPVSSLLEKVIRWGYTPLPDLINELVQGHDLMMGRIGELTGMNSEKVHIPGVPARTLSPPPEASLLASSQIRNDSSDSIKPLAAEPEATEPVQKAPPPAADVPSFVNLHEREEKTIEQKLPNGPEGVDLASLGIK